MGGDGAGVVELEHGFVRRRRDGADGHLGEEEGDEVSEGFRGQVSEEAVLHVAWDMVGMEFGGARLRLRLWTRRAQSWGRSIAKTRDLYNISAVVLFERRFRESLNQKGYNSERHQNHNGAVSEKHIVRTYELNNSL